MSKRAAHAHTHTLALDAAPRTYAACTPSVGTAHSPLPPPTLHRPPLPTPPAGLAFGERSKALGAAWKSAPREVLDGYAERARDRKAAMLADGTLPPPTAAGTAAGGATKPAAPKKPKQAKPQRAAAAAAVECEEEPEAESPLGATSSGAGGGEAASGGDDEDASFTRKSKPALGLQKLKARGSAAHSSSATSGGGDGGGDGAPDGEEEDGHAVSSGGARRKKPTAYISAPTSVAAATAGPAGGGGPQRKRGGKGGKKRSRARRDADDDDDGGSGGDAAGSGEEDDEEAVTTVVDPRADALAGAAAALKAGRASVVVRDGFIVGTGAAAASTSYDAPEDGIVPRMRGRMNYKPFVFLEGDTVALVVPAWEDFAGGDAQPQLAAIAAAAGFPLPSLETLHGACAGPGRAPGPLRAHSATPIVAACGPRTH